MRAPVVQWVGTLWLVSAAVAGAQPLPESGLPPPRPFPRGSSLGGLSLGFGAGGGETAFAAGVRYGYFVFDGVAPGLEIVASLSDRRPNTLELAPFVRIFPWRAYPISPMILVKGGRLLVEALPDLWLVGGGGGLVWFSSPQLAFTIEAVYVRFLPEDRCSSCDQTTLSAGVGILF
jgi:hypothetical protein